MRGVGGGREGRAGDVASTQPAADGGSLPRMVPVARPGRGGQGAQNGVTHLLRKVESPPHLFRRGVGSVARIAKLNTIGRQYNGILQGLGKRCASGPNEIEKGLDVVGLGERDLPPDEQRFEVFLGGLLAVEGNGAGEKQGLADR